MEKKKQCLSTNILSESIKFITETLTFISSLSSDPLFSIFITLYTLILLYFPCIFFPLIFSPILISTALLLSTLLRLGSSSSSQTPRPQEHPSSPSTPQRITCGTETEPPEFQLEEEKLVLQSFIEWNVRAPLDVIYEEYEGEDDEEDDHGKEDMGIERTVSLSLFYPESDSGSSSDGDFTTMEGWNSPEGTCFRWEEEEKDDGGLIEITLDGNGKREMSFQVMEEENLIEIDISPTRDPVCVRFN